MTSNSHEPFRLNNVFVHSIKIILFSALDKLESPDMYIFNGRWRISELSKFFNKLILLGHFPQAWEFANVTPVFKKGVKQLLNNYWPISLLSRLGKTMERSVHKYVYSCCIQHHIFTASPDMYVFNGRWRISELSKFFNKLILLGHFPQAWEFANVTPVFKKGVKQLLNNYWPISLLSRLGKTMERSVHKYVYSCCIQHHIFTASQSGFIQGDSTMYQLLQLYDTFCKAVDNGKEVELVFFFLNITKAFDMVWHKGLLHKHKALGISDNLLNLLGNYLSNRKQRVGINGKMSSYMM